MSAINLDEIKGNSHKENESIDNEDNIEEETEESEENISPIVKGHTEKKKNKIMGGFFNDAKELIQEKAKDEWAPRIIDSIADGIKFLVDLAFYGKDDMPKRKRKKGLLYYNSLYDDFDEDDEFYPKKRKHKRRNINMSAVAYVDTFNDAQDVIRELKSRIRKFGKVSLYVLNQLVDQPGDFTDYNWGWTDPELKGAYPEKLSDGTYEIVMPPMVDIRDRDE